MKNIILIGGILFFVGLIGILTILGIWIFKFNFTVGLIYIFALMCVIGFVLLEPTDYYAG